MGCLGVPRRPARVAGPGLAVLRAGMGTIETLAGFSANGDALSGYYPPLGEHLDLLDETAGNTVSEALSHFRWWLIVRMRHNWS